MVMDRDAGKISGPHAGGKSTGVRRVAERVSAPKWSLLEAIKGCMIEV